MRREFKISVFPQGDAEPLSFEQEHKLAHDTVFMLFTDLSGGPHRVDPYPNAKEPTGFTIIADNSETAERWERKLARLVFPDQNTISVSQTIEIS